MFRMLVVGKCSVEFWCNINISRDHMHIGLTLKVVFTWNFTQTAIPEANVISSARYLWTLQLTHEKSIECHRCHYCVCVCVNECLRILLSASERFDMNSIKWYLLLTIFHSIVSHTKWWEIYASLSCKRTQHFTVILLFYRGWIEEYMNSICILVNLCRNKIIKMK